MSIFILLILAIPLITWAVSVYLISKSIKFKYFFLLSFIILITYISVIYLGEGILWSSDPYGLGIVFRVAGSVVAHTILVFSFALFLRVLKHYSQQRL